MRSLTALVGCKFQPRPGKMRGNNGARHPYQRGEVVLVQFPSAVQAEIKIVRPSWSAPTSIMMMGRIAACWITSRLQRLPARPIALCRTGEQRIAPALLGSVPDGYRTSISHTTKAWDLTAP